MVNDHGMIKTLAAELAPVRVHAVHPGAVGDSPVVARIPPAPVEKTSIYTAAGHLRR
jgi:hypothetical protein